MAATALKITETDPRAWIDHWLAKAAKAPDPLCFWHTVSPELAAELLARNDDNRVPSESAIMRYMGAMVRDEWAKNGQTVVVAEDGQLNDGQQRLEACVRSGRSFRSLMVFGVERDSRHTLDQGKRRSIRDILHMKGEKNVYQLTGALTALLGYNLKDFNILDHGQATAQQVLALLRANPTISQSFHHGYRMKKRFKGSDGLWAGIHYILAQRNPEKAEVFFETIEFGVGIEHLTDPRAKLAGRLQDHIAGVNKLTRGEILALTVKAWNAWLRGERIPNLRWRRRGPQVEDFPEAISGAPKAKPHDVPDAGGAP